VATFFKYAGADFEIACGSGSLILIRLCTAGIATQGAAALIPRPSNQGRHGQRGFDARRGYNTIGGKPRPGAERYLVTK
jgi:hypothetical protein